jgi:hypothetical protein
MVQLFPRAFLPCLILLGESCSKMPRLRCLPMYRPGKCAGMQLELRQSSSHSLLIPIYAHCTGCFYIYLILHSVRSIVLMYIFSSNISSVYEMRISYRSDSSNQSPQAEEYIKFQPICYKWRRSSLTIYISTSSEYSIPSFPFNPIFLYIYIYI